MINALLHGQPVALDRNDHRRVRLRVPITDWSFTTRLNSLLIVATEFGDAAREYPIVFVRTGEDDDGKPAIAPIAVMGVKPQQNLYLDDGRWRAMYLPAMLRTYPFCVGRIDAERYALYLDAGWSGVGTNEGERLFDEQGEPTPFLQEVQQALETLEADTDRTRLMCRRLRDLDLLREMRYDATMPDGSTLTVDGFLMVDQDKLNAISDDIVLELHKSGALGLVHAHYVSLGGMRKLIDWHIQRVAAGAPTGKPGTSP